MIYEVFLRKVKEEDMDEVFKLSNEDYVRQYSLNKEKIRWEHHVTWFSKVMQSPNNVFFVVTNKDNEFFGQIRYKIEYSTATVSISLCEKIIGRGLSYNILIKSMENLKKEYRDIKRIYAVIAIENIPSKKLFEKAGFKYLEVNNEIMKYTFSYE
ncbi:GNAT family N-acetyltransferase [Clostridium grantii]|uniref:Protein N-acetyltransferase, RimJ/RimL family n=1 Tax=Clostridium grantii DSM 8605 TaxID=1121316 RepID=A0A1M5W774_9CLOT|nr:GNAT family N-acetyltransferase [Clostridium grantii]SHH83278.1 Protein N-acetyltransferase, RimJ/RimL family [Clostridium grantii DSM 8605]